MTRRLCPLVTVVLVLTFAGCTSNPGDFDAGAIEDFQRGSVTTFLMADGVEIARTSNGEPPTYDGPSRPTVDVVFHLVRLDNGDFLALYAKDPHRGCTVPWRPVFEFEGQRGWFRNPCHGETYDMSGRRVFGPSPRDLDRFPVKLRGRHVFVNLDIEALILGDTHAALSDPNATPMPTVPAAPPSPTATVTAPPTGGMAAPRPIAGSPFGGVALIEALKARGITAFPTDQAISVCGKDEQCEVGVSYNFTAPSRNGSFELWVYDSEAARALEWAVAQDGSATPLIGNAPAGGFYGVANLVLLHSAPIDEAANEIIDALLGLAAGVMTPARPADGSPLGGADFVNALADGGLDYAPQDHGVGCTGARASGQVYGGPSVPSIVLWVYPSPEAFNADWTLPKGGPPTTRLAHCPLEGEAFWSENLLLDLGDSRRWRGHDDIRMRVIAAFRALPSSTSPTVGHPLGTLSGNATVDAVIEAYIAQDIDRLLALARYEASPCATTTSNDWYGPPPMCPDGVPAGTPIEIMTVSGCHGVVRTRDDLHYGLPVAVPNSIRLYAVAPAVGRPDPRAEYLVFFASRTQNGDDWGRVFETGAGGFIHQDGGCGFSPQFMVERYAPGEFLVAPPRQP